MNPCADVLPTDGVTVVYDGDCPLCRRYVTVMRLRETAGSVHLINAREAPDAVLCLASHGYQLDEGMVVRLGDALYHGSQAMHMLALISSRHGWLNRLSSWVFRSATRARTVYPWLVRGRNLLLRILGRRPLSADPATRSASGAKQTPGPTE